MCAPAGPPNPLRTRCEARKALRAPTPPEPAHVVIRGEGETALFFAVLAAMIAFIGLLAVFASLVS